MNISRAATIVYRVSPRITTNFKKVHSHVYATVDVFSVEFFETARLESAVFDANRPRRLHKSAPFVIPPTRKFKLCVAEWKFADRIRIPR